MRAFRRICTLIIGFVLFTAGILKLMDPVGAGFVVEEYFKFLHLRFLVPISEAAGVLMAFVETILGVALLTGVWGGIVRWTALGVLGFFTVLTFVLWAVNPDFDCGCFGQALHLTHGQSLVKNLFLLALWAVAYLPLSKIFEARKIKIVSFGIAVLSVVLFSFYSLVSIPLLDFTPFKPGEELLSEDGASTLPFTDVQGEYRDSLAANGNVLVVSVPEPGEVADWGKISILLSDASAAGFEPMVLVSGIPEEMESLTSDLSILSRIWFADHRTLLTFNRSNGGCVWVSDGTVVKKWSSRSYPKHDDLVSLASVDPVEAVISTNSPERLKMQGFLLYVFAVMLLL